jgi:hypothetical protein
MSWENSGHMASQTKFFRTLGWSSLKPIKPGLCWESQDEWHSCVHPSTNWIGGWVGSGAGLDISGRGKISCCIRNLIKILWSLSL